MNTYSEDWREWFKRNQQGEFNAELVDYGDMEGWQETEMDFDGEIHKVLYREGAPYAIQGVKIYPPGRNPFYLPSLRRIPKYEKGFVAIAVDKTSDRFILQAKQEQGNSPDSSFTVIAPTIQMSEYNYKRLHGGPAPQRAEWVPHVKTWYSVPQDGGMLLRKRNQVGFVELDIDSVETYPNERIFTMKEIQEAIAEGLCADHILQAIGIWTAFRG